MPQLPTFCRIDGKSFHTWTSDLKRPYDERLSKLFVDTTKFLIEETGARIGYTQSDEITLCWYFEDYKSEMFFNGKCHKLNSVIASLVTGFFNHEIFKAWDHFPGTIGEFEKTHIPDFVRGEGGPKQRSLAFFDCRTWQVPSLDEAANVFLWREQDAMRNSISMAAQSLYSHKELHEKNTKEMQEMIFAKGINWNDYPTFFKKGTYLTRQKETFIVDSEKELSSPSEFMRALNNPKPLQGFERTVIKELEIPPLKSITNRVEALFKGETPIEKGVEK
jgi:tRNA(His) 5'-end guanylyltransferase